MNNFPDMSRTRWWDACCRQSGFSVGLWRPTAWISNLHVWVFFRAVTEQQEAVVVETDAYHLMSVIGSKGRSAPTGLDQGPQFPTQQENIWLRSLRTNRTNTRGSDKGINGVQCSDWLMADWLTCSYSTVVTSHELRSVVGTRTSSIIVSVYRPRGWVFALNTKSEGEQEREGERERVERK